MKLFTKTSLAMILLLGISTPNAFATDTWMVSTDSGCKIYNPEPQPNESVTWSGDCMDGYAHGYGKLQWYVHNEPQSSYMGDYQQGHAHGKGTVIYTDGDEYVGDWKDSKRHGKGIMNYTDGMKYTGEWQDDKKHGNGTITFDDGEKYTGEWQNDLPHGKGMFIASFMIYDGEYYNGVMQGWGTMLVTENNLNTAYEGQWTNGNMNGVGRYIIPNNPDRHVNDENGYWQDDYLIIPALFKEKKIDKYLSKEQHAKLVQKLGKQVQRPKEVLLPFRQYLTDPTPSKAQ